MSNENDLGMEEIQGLSISIVSALANPEITPERLDELNKMLSAMLTFEPQNFFKLFKATAVLAATTINVLEEMKNGN